MKTKPNDDVAKFLADNQAELEESGITVASLNSDIAQFSREIEYTKEFKPYASGSDLDDLVVLFEAISKDLHKSTVSSALNLARAVDTMLKKVDGQPYMIKKQALLRYANMIGLNPYYLFDYEQSKGAVDYDVIFAADSADTQNEAEKNRARYSRGEFVDKCVNAKVRNSAYKNIELDKDAYKTQSQDFLDNCKSILTIMDEPLPVNELLIPYITFNSLIENYETQKQSLQEPEQNQVTRDGEEGDTDTFVHTGVRRVPIKEAKQFWATIKSKDFQIQRPFDEMGVGRPQSMTRPFIIGLTNKLYDAILKREPNKDKALEIFKELY